MWEFIHCSLYNSRWRRIVPKTLYRKILDARTVAVRPSGERLLYIDRHYVDETCFTCFDALAERGRGVRRPDLTFAFADHTVPTRGGRTSIRDIEIRTALDRLDADAARQRIELFGMGSPFQGIAHVSAPEQGLTLPGLVVVGSDSHMPTHGGLGALGMGIGLSEQTHVLATQTLWHQPLRDVRVRIDGVLPPGVAAKDVILGVIGEIGASAAIGSAVEFCGSLVEAMSVEQRMTLCNMAVEAGARAALVRPDGVTFAYLDERARAPRGADRERARRRWAALASDPGVAWDREYAFDAARLAPMVTWGTSPEDAVPITGRVPDPAAAASPAGREKLERALRYMDLEPGRPMAGLPIDRVFIGSCTNGRIEDLRLAAAVARGRRVRVPTLVAPGSQAVKRQAEAEGLDRIFLDAGMQWGDPGCSMCVGMNGDRVGPGERCASTSNRNFMGRQGPGSRTHLMSPGMAAAAAVAGRLVDVRTVAPPGEERRSATGG